MIIREMQLHDLECGFLETLHSLSSTKDVVLAQAFRSFYKIAKNPLHKIFVAIDDVGVVGTITLFCEQKFIHSGGIVGHIEDMATREGWQGKGIGKKLVKHACNEAKRLGCYKIILNCKEDVISFYKKLGFKKHESCMRKDIN